MKHCVVLAGIVWLSAGSASATCPPPGESAAGCDPDLQQLSFAEAATADHERLVVHGSVISPTALSVPQAADVGEGPSMPPLPVHAGALRGEDAAAAAVATARGGLMTASAIPEPNVPLLMLAGLAVVAVLLRRRARREE